jgi:hypothetical protein
MANVLADINNEKNPQDSIKCEMIMVVAIY